MLGGGSALCSEVCKKQKNTGLLRFANIDKSKVANCFSICITFKHVGGGITDSQPAVIYSV